MHPKEPLAPGLDINHLSHAIIATIYQWEEPRYHADLRRTGGTTITGSTEAFEWFLGEWRVARNLGTDYKEMVREYLDKTLRTQLATRPVDSKVIDAAAEHIRQQGWSSMVNKDAPEKKHRNTVSLVSKVGFFICPEELVPCDTDARKGLNILIGPAGKIPLNSSYREYFPAFLAQFKTVHGAIKAALKEDWCITLAGRLLASTTDLTTAAFEHKVFDNYLLELGRA